MGISVNFDGTIYSYSAFMLDRVPLSTKTDDIDFNKVNKAVEQKVKPMYKELEEKNDRGDYGEPQYVLTILKDGRRAVICTMSVTAVDVIEADNSESRTSDLLQMVIPID